MKKRKPSTPRRRDVASKRIEYWKRRLSKDPDLRMRLTNNDTTEDVQLSLFAKSILNSCEAFSLDATKLEHWFVLLGIFSSAYFGPQNALNALSAGLQKRGRPGIDKDLLAYHSKRIDQIIQLRGTRIVTAVLKRVSVYDAKPFVGKLSKTKRAEIIQDFWPEHYEDFEVDTIAELLPPSQKSR
jgi:hypothetical protein